MILVRFFFHIFKFHIFHLKKYKNYVSEYIYFFTGEDYEKQMKSKLNKIKLNLITVLRHCKRLREHRIKNDLRYVILTKK